MPCYLCRSSTPDRVVISYSLLESFALKDSVMVMVDFPPTRQFKTETNETRIKTEKLYQFLP